IQSLLTGEHGPGRRGAVARLATAESAVEAVAERPELRRPLEPGTAEAGGPAELASAHAVRGGPSRGNEYERGPSNGRKCRSRTDELLHWAPPRRFDMPTMAEKETHTDPLTPCGWTCGLPPPRPGWPRR